MLRSNRPSDSQAERCTETLGGSCLSVPGENQLPLGDGFSFEHVPRSGAMWIRWFSVLRSCLPFPASKEPSYGLRLTRAGEFGGSLASIREVG